MTWYNAERDNLPTHNEQVLISVNGVYYITVYNALENRFYLKDQSDTFYQIGTHKIYWTEFESLQQEAKQNA